MVPLNSLETPHAVVDLGRARANVELVHGYARAHGLALRPHTKTHKDDRIGRLQGEHGARGLTVATAKEAEVMARVTRDLLVAYPPIDPCRVERLLTTPVEVELTMALDSLEAIERIQAAAARLERRVRLLVELDLGGRRTGVNAPAELVELAHRANSAWTRFDGVLYHPGQLRGATIEPAARLSRSEVEARTAELGEEERWRAASSALRAELGRHLEALDAANIACPVVSGGNTPSLFWSHLVPELTEIRPGTYVYSDRDIASQGVLPWSACAYSVLATVVSTAVSGQAVIDAGTKALAKEPLPGLPGYGVLLDRPEIVVKATSEEHGLLDLEGTSWRPRVGERVRVVPNHVCVSVHLQDRIAFLDDDELEVRSVPARGHA